MTTMLDRHRAEVHALLERLNKIGRLLPKDMNDIDPDDVEAMAQVRITLAEFKKSQAELEATFARHRRERAAADPNRKAAGALKRRTAPGLPDNLGDTHVSLEIYCRRRVGYYRPENFVPRCLEFSFSLALQRVSLP